MGYQRFALPVAYRGRKVLPGIIGMLCRVTDLVTYEVDRSKPVCVSCGEIDFLFFFCCHIPCYDEFNFFSDILNPEQNDSRYSHNLNCTVMFVAHFATVLPPVPKDSDYFQFWFPAYI